MLELSSELLYILWIRIKVATDQGDKAVLQKYLKFAKNTLILSFILHALKVVIVLKTNGSLHPLDILILIILLLFLGVKFVLLIMIKKYCEHLINLKELIKFFKPLSILLSILFLIDILINTYIIFFIQLHINVNFLITIIGRIVVLLLILDIHLKTRKVSL